MYRSGISNLVGKISTCSPKAHAAAYVIWSLRVAYFKVHHPIYYYCAYFHSIRAKAFDITPWVQAWMRLNARCKKLLKKRQEQGSPNVEIDLYTTLEIRQ